MKPPPLRGFFISSPIEGGLIKAEGLFDLEMTMVSVLNKKTRIQRRKSQVQDVLAYAAEDQNQIRTSSR